MTMQDIHAEEWQPIDTARKDVEKQILAFVPAGKHTGAGYAIITWSDYERRWIANVAGWIVFDDSDLTGDLQPTHWKPLKPPA